MVSRTHYDREASDIDVASELENLRRHYADLQEKKRSEKGRALKKAMTAKPSQAQLRLYKEGVYKITALKIEEKAEKDRDPFAVNSRNTSPSPVCDRLYQQGMLHKFEKERKEKRDESSPANRKRITSSPVCDRLYLQGLMKQKARRATPEPEIVSSASLNNKPLSRQRAQSIDRLYQYGVQKIRSRSKSREPKEKRRTIRSTSPNATCDRLYEQGKTKLRSISKSKLPPSNASHVQKTRGRRRTPAGTISRPLSLEGDDLEKLLIDDAPTTPPNYKLRDHSPVPKLKLSDDNDDDQHVSDEGEQQFSDGDELSFD